MNALPSPSTANWLSALSTCALLAGIVLSGTAQAHGNAGHDPATPNARAGHMQHMSPQAMMPEQQEWGIAGDAKNATRTLEIRMSDEMRFSPNHIEVQLGETVRLVATNDGKVLHEIVIGTPAVLQAHAEMMKKFPNMQHDEPHMAHVDAGRRGEIVWTFNRPGTFEFACLIPGHFEAGMIGRITVRP